MFHIQTIVLGYFPFRLHAYKGRDVTHLMDDPDRRRRRHGRGRARRRAAVPARWHRRARRRWSPDHRGDPHRARCGPQRADGCTRTVATRWPRSRCRARTSRSRRTASTSTRRVRDVWGLPAGRITYNSHAHDVACARALGAAPRRGDAKARARRTRMWVTSPGIPDSFAPAAPADLPTLDGHRRGWASIPRTSVCDPCATPWDVDNVVIADSSVFPTSSGYGPTLTLVALAIRAARSLATTRRVLEFSARFCSRRTARPRVTVVARR